MPEFSVTGLTSIIDKLLPEPHAGLLAGLLFGTKASLSREFYDALVATGVLHIIALSGMNITIMENLVAGLMVPVVGRRWASAITIGVIVWFVWFVGATPSVIRAAIMGSLSLLAVIFGRQYWALSAWVIACSIMLVINFSWIADVSFQLSALATLGIILFGTKAKNITGDGQKGFPTARTALRTLPIDVKNVGSMDDYARGTENSMRLGGGEHWWDMFRPAGPVGIITRPVIESIKESLRLTFAAQVFTVPVIFFVFRQFSLVAPLTNLAIGWMIVPLTTLGWITVLAGFVELYMGQIVAWADWVLLEYLIRTVQFMSHVPFSHIQF